MITVTEDYVSFNTAKLLKEKGFDENTPVNYFVGDDKPRGCVIGEMIHHKKLEEDTHLIACPTLQMTMKWLRQVHNIFIAINMVPKIPGGIEDKRCYFFQPYKNRIFHNFPLNYSIKIYSTYEQACEAAIKYCLKNLI